MSEFELAPRSKITIIVEDGDGDKEVFYDYGDYIRTENRKTQKCWFCGKWFEPHKENQKFCPVRMLSSKEKNRSSCANAYYAWLHRKKDTAKRIWFETKDEEKVKKGIETGYPVDMETVRKWIKEWQVG